MSEDTMELTLNSPITEEQWDAITDVDFDNTNRIWFHTKHGKEVEFVKRIRGKWILSDEPNWYCCSECGAERRQIAFMEYFCPNCGADMREEKQDDT